MMTSFTYPSGLPVVSIELQNYFLDLVQAGERLVVAFEPAGTIPDRLDFARVGWGTEFLAAQGFSVLSVKPKQLDWYRGADLHAFFAGGDFTRIAAGRQLSFYGGSMGGYAALVFSAAWPGSNCVAFSPQSTLDAGLVPWEKRFAEGRAQDWSGAFRDAAELRDQGGQSYVFFDPFQRGDAAHVARLPAHLRRVRVPFSGHSTIVALQRSGLLKDMVLPALRGALEPAQARRIARQFRGTASYYANLASASGKHPALEQMACEKAMQLSDYAPRSQVFRLAVMTAMRRCGVTKDAPRARVLFDHVRRFPFGPVSTRQQIAACKIMFQLGERDLAKDHFRDIPERTVRRVAPAHIGAYRQLAELLSDD